MDMDELLDTRQLTTFITFATPNIHTSYQLTTFITFTPPNINTSYQLTTFTTPNTMRPSHINVSDTHVRSSPTTTLTPHR